MDQRETAIQTISDLYPTDSRWEKTNKIGRKLLQQAKDEVNSWRDEPTEVLLRYAQLCELQARRDMAG